MSIERKVDPITVAVLDNRFTAVTEEIARTMMRTSRSPIFAEARDFATAIFDKELRLIAQRDYLPVLAGAIPVALENMVESMMETSMKVMCLFTMTAMPVITMLRT